MSSKPNPTPLVSIVIPVYNGANYLAEAIDSALAQTYPHTEIVVVDDGSTDDGATRRVAERYGERIRYLHKTNGGVASALNTGIAAMRGELFSWLSHDDIYKPEKVGRQVETWLNFGQPCIVTGDFETFTEGTDHVQQVPLDGYNPVARPLDTVFFGLINGCALLVPRRLFDEVGVFEVDLPTTQDYHLWYRMARAVPFVRCPHMDVRQRVHPLQGSRQYAHLDEASRMFTHLVEITPVRIMEAYEGSELRFLLKIRRALTPYAGLRTYLTSRIDRLLQHSNYSVTIFTEGEVSLAPEIERLKRSHYPPSQIFTVNLDHAAHSVEYRRNIPGVRATNALTSDDTRPSDIVRAVQQRVDSGPVVFLQACERAFPHDASAGAAAPPSEAQLRIGLQALVAEDGDVARPAGSQQILSELNGLVVRHDALDKLAALLDAPDFNWERAATQLRVVTYEMSDATAVDVAGHVRAALQGEEATHYHRGLSEGAIARLIKEMLDLALPTVLFVQHAAGGGAQTHLQSLMAGLARKANCITAYGSAEGSFHLAVGSEDPSKGLMFSLPKQLPDLIRILRHVGVTQVDVHHIMGFEAHAETLLDGLGVPYDVTLVDYHMVANNPFLCLNTGEFVGDKRLRNLEYNLLRRGPLPVLRKAARVIAISRDLAARVNDLSRGLPVIPARLWHEQGVQLRHVFVPQARNNEPLRILIAGSIGLHKGRKMVMDVAQRIATGNLPLRLHLVGAIDVPAHFTKEVGGALTIHGRYENGRFVETIGSIGPHVAWLPSQAPETWSYVLTDYMNACLPIAATAVGAIPERCHGRPATWLLPWHATDDDWVNLFLRLHASRLEEPPRWAPIDHLPPLEAMYFERYLRPSRNDG